MKNVEKKVATNKGLNFFTIIKSFFAINPVPPITNPINMIINNMSINCEMPVLIYKPIIIRLIIMATIDPIAAPFHDFSAKETA